MVNDTNYQLIQRFHNEDHQDMANSPKLLRMHENFKQETTF